MECYFSQNELLDAFKTLNPRVSYVQGNFAMISISNGLGTVAAGISSSVVMLPTQGLFYVAAGSLATRLCLQVKG